MGLLHQLLLGLVASAAAVSAQGVLANGNSQFPDCAKGCPLLVQAAQACSATDVASQGAWICFCQSGYLKTLRTSATGICDSTCTNPTDLAQISTWYNTNCGADNGASEHPGSGTTTTTTPATDVAPTTDTGSTAATAGSSGTTANGQNNLDGVAVGAATPGTWWDNHYKWIIMLIVLAIVFPLIAWAAVWLKRRHDRKQDQSTTSFNEGITSRHTPMSSTHVIDKSTPSPHVALAGPGLAGSGRDSPQRTRDAYMPYGYGYARSGSRNGERGVHPLARGETPVDMVERGPSAAKGRKIMVREKSLSSGSDDGPRSGWV